MPPQLAQWRVKLLPPGLTEPAVMAGNIALSLASIDQFVETDSAPVVDDPSQPDHRTLPLRSHLRTEIARSLRRSEFDSNELGISGNVLLDDQNTLIVTGETVPTPSTNTHRLQRVSAQFAGNTGLTGVWSATIAAPETPTDAIDAWPDGLLLAVSDALERGFLAQRSAEHAPRTRIEHAGVPWRIHAGFDGPRLTEVHAEHFWDEHGPRHTWRPVFSDPAWFDLPAGQQLSLDLSWRKLQVGQDDLGDLLGLDTVATVATAIDVDQPTGTPEPMTPGHTSPSRKRTFEEIDVADAAIDPETAPSPTKRATPDR